MGVEEVEGASSVAEAVASEVMVNSAGVLDNDDDETAGSGTAPWTAGSAVDSEGSSSTASGVADDDCDASRSSEDRTT